jgi:hypothetical protein
MRTTWTVYYGQWGADVFYSECQAGYWLWALQQNGTPCVMRIDRR